MIPVTKPFLPSRESFDRYLDGIWNVNWWTNNGPVVNALEDGLKKNLHLDKIVVVSNGTIGLQIAIKALELTGEVITTPFSYVATTSSVVWENCEPVFVDIDPNTLNIDPTQIEAAITDETCAILATHCFGNPCEIDFIASIAKKYNLRVIYDAAHCFGTIYKGKSVFTYGDISVTSFHATKLFHSIEGGALFTRDQSLIEKFQFMRNFGHDGPEGFQGVGINAKMSEVHAAMGVVNLKYVSAILKKRRIQCERYDMLLKDMGLEKPLINSEGKTNHSYYPIIFTSESRLLSAISSLEEANIFPRRYFYPSLNLLDYVAKQSCPIAEDISKRVLCLPLYFSLSSKDQNAVATALHKTKMTV
ncbi:MAG: DegT/DnrJ/EryC1/StrS family aminotransferase [Cyclobacteriaceae bacterium]